MRQHRVDDPRWRKAKKQTCWDCARTVTPTTVRDFCPGKPPKTATKR